MNHSYQDAQIAQKYLNFLGSANGKIQQKVLLGAILPRLSQKPEAYILDAASGPGWLAAELKKTFSNVFACDSSEFFIKFVRVNHPGLDSKVADLEQALPYREEFFDTVVFNMGAPDIQDLNAAFKNILAVLKNGGRLIMTVPNPELTYPAAEWKRGLLGALLGKKPTLNKKIPPISGTKIQREFGEYAKIESYYYTLSGYIKAAENSGLKFLEKIEIKSSSNSENFDLNYQLFRYPLILLLEFGKVR